MFMPVLSAIWDQKHMSFLLYVFFVTFELYLHTYVYPQLNTSGLYPSQGNNTRQARHCRRLNHRVRR